MRLAVMFQLLCDHCFGHLPHRGTTIPACPAVPSPVALLQQRALLAELARAAAFAPAHDLARRPMRRRSDQDVHRILTHHPLQNFDLEDVAGLPDQFPYAQRNVPGEDFVAGLGNPDKVLRDVINRVTAIAIVQSSSSVKGCGGLWYAARNRGDEICPPQGGGLNLRFGKSRALALGF
jgi:hypothetical protein